MPAGKRRVSVETLRQAAAVRAAETSISAVAREVGLTTRGLNLLLKGSDPYSGTLQKLERWYVKHAADRQDVTDATTAAAALTVLTHDLPPDERDRAIERAVTWWREYYDAAGVPRPRWIDELATQAEEARDP